MSSGEDTVIPDEVLALADQSRIYDRQDYMVIARWARDEALREAEEAVRRVPTYKGAFAGVLAIKALRLGKDENQ